MLETMKPRPRLPLIVLSIAVLLLGGACTRGEKAGKKAEKELPPIAPIEGMKYYVGGPVMKYDAYNRLRLGGFSGEVAAPTSRGLVLGYKLDPDGKHFDYRTWLNGRVVSKSTGFLDSGGLLWFSERETFDSNGRVVARQRFDYDDARKVAISTVTQLDPETGKILSENKLETPYTPPPEPEDDEEDEEEEEGETGGTQ